MGHQAVKRKGQNYPFPLTGQSVATHDIYCHVYLTLVFYMLTLTTELQLKLKQMSLDCKLITGVCNTSKYLVHFGRISSIYSVCTKTVERGR